MNKALKVVFNETAELQRLPSQQTLAKMELASTYTQNKSAMSFLSLEMFTVTLQRSLAQPPAHTAGEGSFVASIVVTSARLNRIGQLRTVGRADRMRVALES